MFSCPICRKKLKSVSEARGRALSCPYGHGMARTSLLLRKKLGHKFTKWLFNNDKLIHTHLGKDCPSCLKKMSIIKPVQENNLYLDLCKRCKIVWFDKNEWKSFKNEYEELAKETLSEEKKQEERSLIDMDVDKSYLDRDLSFWLYEDFTREVMGGADYGLLRGGKARVHLGLISQTLLAFIVVIGLISLSSYGNQFSFQFGFYTLQPFRLFGLTMLTHFFIHGSVGHIIGNAVFFFLFAPDIEDELGGINFLLLLFSSTFAGLLLFVFFNGSEPALLIGASGGISGMVLYHSIRFPHHRISTGHFMMIKPSVSVVLVGVFYFMINLIFFIFLKDSHIAYSAHIGGAMVGILAALIFR